MTGGEGGTGGPQDHHPDGVVRLGKFEGGAQLDQHAAGLGVALFRAVQGDRGDAPIVDGFVADVFELPGPSGAFPVRPAIDRTDPADEHVRSLLDVNG